MRRSAATYGKARWRCCSSASRRSSARPSFPRHRTRTRGRAPQTLPASHRLSQPWCGTTLTVRRRDSHGVTRSGAMLARPEERPKQCAQSSRCCWKKRPCCWKKPPWRWESPTSSWHNATRDAAGWEPCQRGWPGGRQAADVVHTAKRHETRNPPTWRVGVLLSVSSCSCSDLVRSPTERVASHLSPVRRQCSARCSLAKVQAHYLPPRPQQAAFLGGFAPAVDTHPFQLSSKEAVFKRLV